jgi:hypothetical protein
MVISSPIPGPISGAAARAAAEAELRRAEYHRDDPTVLSRVLDWLGRRFDSVASGTPSGSATLVLVALLVGVVVFAVLRAGRPRRLARAAHAGGDPLRPDAGVDHRRQAAAFEELGQLAQAQREWLRAAVAAIEARGVLDPRPGRTGAAVAREAGAALPGIAAELDAVVAAFAEVWFGRRSATPADVVAAHRLADAARTARVNESTTTSAAQ